MEFYQNVLGTVKPAIAKVSSTIISEGVVLDENQQLALSLPFTGEDVKAALLSIEDTKAPGPDGYTSNFSRNYESVLELIS